MTTDIDQFSHVEKLVTLTQLYLELGLPLQDALRAAEADLVSQIMVMSPQPGGLRAGHLSRRLICDQNMRLPYKGA
jgi:hypothetical protein